METSNSGNPQGGLAALRARVLKLRQESTPMPGMPISATNEQSTSLDTPGSKLSPVRKTPSLAHSVHRNAFSGHITSIVATGDPMKNDLDASLTKGLSGQNQNDKENLDIRQIQIANLERQTLSKSACSSPYTKASSLCPVASKDELRRVDKLLATCQQNPESLEAWYELLDHLERIRKPSNATSDIVEKQTSIVEYHSLLRLYEKATLSLKISGGNRRNPKFVNIWLNYAMLQSNFSPDDARGTFKYMKVQRIGEKDIGVLAAWADAELIAGNEEKAARLREEARSLDVQQASLEESKLGSLRQSIAATNQADKGESSLAISQSGKRDIPETPIATKQSLVTPMSTRLLKSGPARRVNAQEPSLQQHEMNEPGTSMEINPDTWNRTTYGMSCSSFDEVTSNENTDPTAPALTMVSNAKKLSTAATFVPPSTLNSVFSFENTSARSAQRLTESWPLPNPNAACPNDSIAKDREASTTASPHGSTPGNDELMAYPTVGSSEPFKLIGDKWVGIWEQTPNQHSLDANDDPYPPLKALAREAVSMDHTLSLDDLDSFRDSILVPFETPEIQLDSTSDQQVMVNLIANVPLLPGNGRTIDSFGIENQPNRSVLQSQVASSDHDVDLINSRRVANIRTTPLPTSQAQIGSISHVSLLSNPEMQSMGSHSASNHPALLQVNQGSFLRYSSHLFPTPTNVQPTDPYHHHHNSTSRPNDSQLRDETRHLPNDRAVFPNALVQQTIQQEQHMQNYSGYSAAFPQSATLQYSRTGMMDTVPSNQPLAFMMPTPAAGALGDTMVEVNSVTYMRIELIGKGGSSKVYKVMGPDRKILALKRVRVAKGDHEAIVNYSNEISLLQRLKGKSNIVQLHDFEVRESAGIIYLVMECGDIDLAHLLARGRGKPVSSNFLRLYWQQLLEAVHTIHEERIIHGDLKPANFLLIEGSLKLIDFGIAKSFASDDTTSIVRDAQVGTPNYMSPEALLCAPDGSCGNSRKYRLGRPSDIWSLGCILYQMVYGKTPFAHLSMIQKLHCITDSAYEIEFPSIKNRALLEVMKKCLQRDPRKRPTIPELLAHPFLMLDHAEQNHASSAKGGDREDTLKKNAVSRETIETVLQQLKSMNVEVNGASHSELLDELYRRMSFQTTSK